MQQTEADIESSSDEHLGADINEASAANKHNVGYYSCRYRIFKIHISSGRRQNSCIQ